MLKTALICFRGEYSGILKPDLHYIPLEKDFSNIEEVLQKLFDDDFIEQMTERAYRDIVASGRYTYRRFVTEFDGWLDHRLPTGGTEIIMAPVAVRRGNRVSAVRHLDSRDFVVTSIPLGGNNQREAFRAKFWAEDRSANRVVYRSLIEHIATRISPLVPGPVRPAAKRVYWLIATAVGRFRKREG